MPLLTTLPPKALMLIARDPLAEAVVVAAVDEAVVLVAAPDPYAGLPFIPYIIC